MSSRIGKGPWARAFGAALVPDEGVSVAVRGRALAESVEGLRIEPGLITAQVDGCTVTLTTPTIPPRIWSAMTSYARNRGALERAVRGEVQSDHLEHLMTQDWDEPLIPPAGAIVRVCNCDSGGACVHVAALGYAVAEAIDAEPAVLLRWRGCAAHEDAAQPPRATQNPWSGSELPALPVLGRGRAASVPKRLGSSRIRVGDRDLVEALDEAYAALGRSS